jgi:lysophospholipase L1-like esterase
MNVITNGHREWFLDDNVHPNNDGAMEIAKAIYEYLK